MAAATTTLITSTSTSSFPPKPYISIHQHLQRSLQRTNVSRRDMVSLSLLSLSPPLLSPPPSSAFNIGISGPKDWLREQKKKASKFLLAPIDASRESLRSAYLLLGGGDSELSENDLGEIQRLLTSAARDCVPGDRNSFVAFQAKTGVEVCTFRLIVRNASSLLDDKSPVKLEAEAILSDLIRSFTLLNSAANGIEQPSLNRGKVSEALMDTISSLDKFEQGIKDCLEI